MTKNILQESWPWTRWLDGRPKGGAHKLHGHNQEQGGPTFFIVHISNLDQGICPNQVIGGFDLSGPTTFFLQKLNPMISNCIHVSGYLPKRGAWRVRQEQRGRLKLEDGV